MDKQGAAVSLPPLDTRQFINPYADTNGWWPAFFRGGWSWRWLSAPQLYFRPGLEYCVGGSFQVIDPMGRIKTFDRAFDSVFNPQTGCIETLYVQTTDSLCYSSRSRPNCTWKRTVMRNVAPMYLRAANLPYKFIAPERRHDPNKYLQEDWMIVAALWLPAVALTIPAIYSISENQPDGKDPNMYLPLPSCHLRYPRLARNIRENRSAVVEQLDTEFIWATQTTSTNLQADLGPYRTLRPRYLFYMEPVDHHDETGAVVGTRWGSVLRAVPNDDLTPYIFIAFTTEQFPLPGNEEETGQRNPTLEANLEQVRFLGEKAAIRHFNLDSYAPDRSNFANLPRVAFWSGSECIPSGRFVDKNGQEKILGTSAEDMLHREHISNIDTYSISDIVRSSEHTYVLSGNLNEQCSEATQDVPLKVWGSRVWTLPEIVLSKGDTVTIFHSWKINANMEDRAFETIPKIVFTKRAWVDAAHSRQLIEHYGYGNLQLSRLEFTKVALECLLNRKLKIAYAGDRSYAMMGLLRARPPIDKKDSSFQAFARLSLPQDNDRLMERLICLLPKTREESWDRMSDQYSSSLWDVYPETQICGVGDTDTVIIDGAKGAQIQWEGFSPVRNFRSISWRRWAIQKIVLQGPSYFLISIVLVAIDMTRHIGIPLLVFILIFFILPLPYYIWLFHKGKMWDVEPCFFGIEGYAPIECIEEKLFGARMGRMTWSPYGSPISRHRAGEMLPERTFEYEQQGDDEEAQPLIRPSVVDTYPIEAIDPCTPCPKCQHIQENSRRCEDHETELTCWEKSRGEFGQLKVFTLVDTLNMTATLFYAVRPPTAVIIGGSEGGMKRAIACSFDMTTGIMYRETVLRLPSLCTDRMEALPRIRLGLNRPFIPGDVMVSGRNMVSTFSESIAQQPSAAPQFPNNHIPLAPVGNAPLGPVMQGQMPVSMSQLSAPASMATPFAQQPTSSYQQYSPSGVPQWQGTTSQAEFSAAVATPPQPSPSPSAYQNPQYQAQQYQQQGAQYPQQQTGGSPGQPSTVSPVASYTGSPYREASPIAARSQPHPGTMQSGAYYNQG